MPVKVQEARKLGLLPGVRMANNGFMELFMLAKADKGHV
jgi:hypothetical protein